MLPKLSITQPFWLKRTYNTYMEPVFGSENLRNQNEELSHIKNEVLHNEERLGRKIGEAARDALISEEIKNYNKKPDSILHPSYSIPAESIQTLALNLSPEPHDKKVESLLVLVHQKGIKNTLKVVEKLGDTHVEDDLHRFLIQYVKRGFDVKGLKEKTPLSKALHMTLYEVALPESREDKPQALKELISGMEQFYSGMMSISPEKNPKENYIVIEIANSNGSSEFVFYVAVPDSKKDLFEKHILSIFHDAKVHEKNDDHNIFNEDGVSIGAIAKAGGNSIFPIRTYESFDHDPMNVIINSFSKIDKHGEGACLQVLLSPTGNTYTKKYETTIKKIEKGIPLKVAIQNKGLFEELGSALSLAFIGGGKKKEDEEKGSIDTKALEKIKTKIGSPIMATSIRLAVSAGNKERAETLLSHLESSFNQFDDTQGNSIRFKRILSGGKLKNFLRSFAFRSFDFDETIPFNLHELTSFMHFHTSALKGISQLKTIKSGEAPPPLDLPNTGTIIGINRYRSEESKIHITDEDRLRHVYTIGQTGTGKSTLLKNMIIQDIERGNGVCMIDPHGGDVQDVLAHVPRGRLQDVIYFDPAYTERPMGLNMLEFDRRYPEQKTFVVNELFNIFQKLYGAVPESMGPMFEQYFRNAALLVIEDPESGSTLLDVSRVLSNKEFRALKLLRCGNPVVVQFWKEIAEKAGGEGALANIVPYITSKFDVFLANEIMRPIVAQEKSAFNFRDIMDNKKILLVNLSKGRLGDINANLLGLILVGKILMASLSRVDSIGKDLPPFYLYIDEFQNITTPSISTILSEARKYKLSLSIAHQFIAQLEEGIKNAVFGNVGTLVVFRVGNDDAEYLAKQFEPVFTATQIINIDNRNAYVKMLANGKPVKPFNMETLAPTSAVTTDLESVKRESYMKYGRDRYDVETEVLMKYQK